jgi:hypothetical protein
MLDDQKGAESNKSGEIRLRQGANRSEVRPRTEEQGPRGRGCDPVAGCLRTGKTRACTHLRGHIPQKGPLFRAPVRTPREDL